MKITQRLFDNIGKFAFVFAAFLCVGYIVFEYYKIHYLPVGYTMGCVLSTSYSGGEGDPDPGINFFYIVKGKVISLQVMMR